MSRDDLQESLDVLDQPSIETKTILPLADLLRKGKFYIVNDKAPFIPKIRTDESVFAFALNFNKEHKEFLTYVVGVNSDKFEHCIEYLIYRFGTVKLREFKEGFYYFVWSVDPTLMVPTEAKLCQGVTKEWPSSVAQRFFHTLQILIKGEREYIKNGK